MYETESIIPRAAAAMMDVVESPAGADLVQLPLSVTCEAHKCLLRGRGATLASCARVVARKLLEPAAAELTRQLPGWWQRGAAADRRPAVAVVAA